MNVDREALKAKYGDEQVFVVPLSEVEHIEEGLESFEIQDLADILETGYFIPRWKSDYNSEEVEIIPYTAVRVKNELFCVKRLDGSNEARLVDNMSLGIGGHMNPTSQSVNGIQQVMLNMHRELNEELNFENVEAITDGSKLLFNGTLRNLSDDLNRDHLGLYITVLIDEKYKDTISVNETDVLEGDFMHIEDIRAQRDKLEDWSKLVIDNTVIGDEKIDNQ